MTGSMAAIWDQVLFEGVYDRAVRPEIRRASRPSCVQISAIGNEDKGARVPEKAEGQMRGGSRIEK